MKPGPKPSGREVRFPVRISPVDDARLKNRAFAAGISKAEVVRRAISAYLDKPTPRASAPHRRAQLVDLVDLLEVRYQIPRSIARMKITTGKVKVNGEVTTDFEILPQGAIRLEIET